MRWRLTAAVAGVCIAFTGMAWPCPSAYAHALLSASEPADGTSVDRPPSQALLTFTEAPDPSLSIIHALDASGRSVEAGKAATVPGQPQQLRLPLAAVAQGTYTVIWRTTSAIDGHTTAGSFTFGVGVPAAGPIGGTNVAGLQLPSPTVASVAARWLLYVGLLLLVGATFVGVVVTSRPAAISRLGLTGSWAAAAVGLLLTAADQRAAARTSLAHLLGSATGRKLSVEAVALLAAGAAVAWASWRRSRLALSIVGAAAAAVMLARAQAGHADASSAPWFTVGTQWVHLVAAGAWVGGLVWLLVVLRRRDGTDRAGAAARFSSLAAVALGVVALSGAVRAVDEVGAWSRLVHTRFGVTLLVKVGLFAALAGLGALNRFRHVPEATVGRLGGLRRAVRGEAALATGILGATALLTGLPPSASVAAASKPAPVSRLSVTGHDYATSVRVHLVVTPGMAGPNLFDATVVDYDTGDPIPASTVVLRLQLVDRIDVGAATLPLVQEPDSHWRARGRELSIDGRWTVTAVVQTPDDAVDVPMEVQTRRQPSPIEVTRAPGLPDLYTIGITATRRVQAYLDPGHPGFNDVHMTVFEGQQELPLVAARIDAVDPNGRRYPLGLRRLGPGHFVGAVELGRGAWRFELQADAQDSSHLDAQFRNEVKG